MRLRRALRYGAAGLPLGVLTLLAAQAAFVLTREYLPTDPGYVVEGTARPAGAAGERPTLRMVMFGDSTVAGVGSPTAEESLAMLVASRVAERLGRPVDVVGYGMSGARTEETRLEQIPLVDPDVDVVVLVIGSNDVTHLTPWWRMEERTRALLIAARRQADAPVVLGGIPEFKTVPALPQPLRWLVGRYAVPLRAAQRRAAADVEGARFVDIAAEASPRFVGRPESMSSDGFHPSPLGYRFWADALAPAIAAAVDGEREKRGQAAEG